MVKNILGLNRTTVNRWNQELIDHWYVKPLLETDAAKAKLLESFLIMVLETTFNSETMTNNGYVVKYLGKEYDCKGLLKEPEDEDN